MPVTDKLKLAREIVRSERNLRDLPKPDHKAVVALVALPVATLRRRHEACGLGKRVEMRETGQLVEATASAESADWARANAKTRILVNTETGGQGARQIVSGVEIAAEARGPFVAPRMFPVPAEKVASGSVGIIKRQPFGRIIRTIVRDGREYVLHATRGWRSYRVGA